MSTTANRSVSATSDLLPAAPAYGVRAKVAREVVRRILRHVPVTADIDGTVFGAPLSAGNPVIEVSRPEPFFARLARSPMIGLGESYMAGEWRAADGSDLADTLAPFAERMTSLIRPTFYKLRHAVLPKGLNPANTLAGARKNIEAHYDLSNDMFAQFLDPSLSYSSALFSSLDPRPTLADLERAQLRKVDEILDAAGVTAGTRVLEIGTGWGTLAIRAAERGAHVTTLTISREQADLAQQRVDAAGMTDRVEIALRDYRDQTGEFDAIVSVEMIEAVGEEYWPTYFAKIDSLLAPHGKASIQAILIGARPDGGHPRHLHVDPQVHLPRRDAALHRGDRPGAAREHRPAHLADQAVRPALRAHAAAVARAVPGELGGRAGARLRRDLPPDVGVLPGLLRGRLPHRLPRRRPDHHGALRPTLVELSGGRRRCRPPGRGGRAGRG